MKAPRAKSLLGLAVCLCLFDEGASAAFTGRDAPFFGSKRKSATKLHAIGVLARKAKEAELRKYVEGGVEDKVMEQYNLLKSNVDGVDLTSQTVGPLQQALTKRKGTITVIAEYKRKNDQAESGYISEMLDPEILSPTFREFGAGGIAVMADERMGGCTYKDIHSFAEEQRRAKNEVPGTVPVINNDLVVDELQVAMSKAYGAASCVITLEVVGDDDELRGLLKAAKALDMEPIVAVSSREEAQKAIDLGARLISVVSVTGVDEKAACVADLAIPEGQQVCTIANIMARNDNLLLEIEEGWALRDKGFNCVWLGEALYKSGTDETEHAGAILRSVQSKSSLKWASPKASSGRGEGAKEYLGDILM